MKLFFLSLVSFLFFSGCSATWEGIKQDSSDAMDWSKGKVNQGASFVKEKTDK